MQCPSCQNDLVEIPTREGPQLDVCPSHGLWLDVEEVTLWVGNYRALEEASHPPAHGSTTPQSATCPRCGGLLDRASMQGTALLACCACRGWWLPKGSLAGLNATARAGARTIPLQEAEFYRQAQKRASKAQRGFRFRHRPRRPPLWFWTVFLATALLLALFLVMVGIRKFVAAGPWPAPSSASWIVLAAGTLAGLGLTCYGIVLNNRKRLIESIPTSAVRSLAVGLVEIRGRAEPERELLRAPFSGMPCVLFSYTVEERRTSGQKSRWETIAEGTSREPFYVNDETGKVLVVPFDAQLMLPDNRTTRSNWSGTLPEEASLGLSRLGIAVSGWLGEKTIRCTERFILPDEQVYVMGTAQELQRAGEGTENAARLYVGSNRDNVFIISNRSEKELLSGLQWQVWASMAGGPALALVSLLLMFTRDGAGQ
jgi:Zn-finger nucleic acid-binding protein